MNTTGQPVKYSTAKSLKKTAASPNEASDSAFAFQKQSIEESRERILEAINRYSTQKNFSSAKDFLLKHKEEGKSYEVDS